MQSLLMPNEMKKKIFLIISANPERIDIIKNLIFSHYDNPILYSASNGNVGLLKLKNASADLIIIDSKGHSFDGIKMIEVVLLENTNPHMAIIVIGHAPEKEKFKNELVIGKLYFIEESLDENEFAKMLPKALNFTSQTSSTPFSLRYLSTDDILIREGDSAEFVYILKRGRLQAYHLLDGQKIILGTIEVGEFVGEMAYLNNGPRTAYIEAISDAELIEVPIELLDKILFKRPAWTKSLMQTLSKRLKISNKLQK